MPTGPSAGTPILHRPPPLGGGSLDAEEPIMAKAIRNPVRNGYAVLTPNTFRAIDNLARKRAGRPFQIGAPADMEGAWGRSGGMADSVLIDARRLPHKFDSSRARRWKEMGMLYIASQIEVAEFHGGRRPEIDLSQVPADRIFEFVALHEIAHTVDNVAPGFLGYQSLSSLPNTKEATKAWHTLNEVLADRYAWNAMFPGVPLPMRCGCEQMTAATAAWLVEFESAGIRREDVSRRRLDTHPATWIPMQHLSKGIPWSPLARPELAEGGAWLDIFREARRQYRLYSIRSFRRTAHRMSALWARVARNPTAEAMRFSSQGQISNYRTKEEVAEIVRLATARAARRNHRRQQHEAQQAQGAV